MEPITDRLPAAENDFASLIDNQMVYADKTDLVADLARQTAFFFLARPRGFGATLLLSTFEELFKNGKGRFKGLKLEKDEPWVAKRSYKVIRLDLSNIDDCDKALSFRENFVSTLARAFEAAGAEWGGCDYWVLDLEDALEQFETDELVLLIDNYDAPLISVLDDTDEFKNRQGVLEYFFLILKSLSHKIRFLFITGMAGFNSYGVMANNIKDISFVPMYGAIAGISQAELELNFKPFIARAAKLLDEKEPQNRWNEQKVLDELKQGCGVYSFERKMKCPVYSARAVIDFLLRPEEGFKHSLPKSGGNAALICRRLDNLIARGTPWGPGLGELPDFLALDCEIKSYEEKLSPVFTLITEPGFPLEALLYQAGYLTIRRAEGEELYIGFPNRAAREELIDLVLQRLTAGRIARAADFIDKYQKPVLKAFSNKDLPAMKDVLNAIIGECSCNFNAHLFRDVLKASLNMLGLFELRCRREEHSSWYPSRLTVECDKCLYVFEFRTVKNRGSVAGALKKAREQLMERVSYDKSASKQIVPVAGIIVNKNGQSAPPVCKIVRLKEVDLNQKLKPKRARRT